jgi:hypothetical protein
MGPSPDHPWLLELNELELPVVSRSGLLDQIKVAQSLGHGRLVLSSVIGQAPLWKRLLGAKNESRGHFAVEWFNQVASLIFLDENWSEYRAIDGAGPIEASDEERTQVAHGEVKPHPKAECLSKERAFRAIAESLESDARPAWLQYRVVR